MRARLSLLALCAVLTAAPAGAQENGLGTDRALAPLIDCRRVADARVRVGCYDAALDRLRQAIDARQIVVVRREEVYNARTILGRPLETAATIDATATSVTALPDGRWIVRLSTDAVWRTSEADARFAPRAGGDVHIRRGAFGTYWLRFGRKGWAVHAARIG